MSVTRKAILLGSGSLFVIAVAIYLYGALANVNEADRANLSSIAAIMFILDILGSALILRFIRNKGEE